MAQTLSAMSRPAIRSSAARRANTEHTDWGSYMRPPRASISSSLLLVDPSSSSAGLELPFATAEVLGLGIDRGGALSVLLPSPSPPRPSSSLTSGVAMLASNTSSSPSSLGAALTASTSAWGGGFVCRPRLLALARAWALSPPLRGRWVLQPFQRGHVDRIGRQATSDVITRGHSGQSRTLWYPHVEVPLTRKLSVLTSPFPNLVRDPPTAPPASTPTNVGFTIVFFGGVVAIVWFLLELAGLRMLPGKKVISRSAF